MTGDPLFSLTSTKDLAAELQRTKSGGDVLSALPGYLRGTVKTPVYFAGLLGLAIAIWKFPLRTIVPLVLFLAGAFTFVATGMAGLSVIVRYLLVPSVMMTPVRRRRDRRLDDDRPAARACAARGRRARRRSRSSASPTRPCSRRASSASTTSSSFRGEQGRSLHRLLETGAVERGAAVRRGVGPDAQADPRHALGPRPARRAASWRAPTRPRRRSARRATGSRIFPVGRTNILRTGLRREHGRDHAGAGPRLPADRDRQVLRRIPALPARACVSACGAGRRRRLGLALAGVLALGASGCGCGGSSTGCRSSTTSTRPRTSSPRRSATTSPTATTRTTSSTRRRSRTCCTWCSGPGSAAVAVRRRERGRQRVRDRPDARCSPCPRTTSAVLGTAAVAFVYLTGARLYDRRVGLVAAAVMAVAFLPVFYSHLALNDVPALLPLAVSVYGSAGVLTRGRAARLRDRRRRAGPGGGDEVHGRDRGAAADRRLRRRSCSPIAAPPCAASVVAGAAAAVLLRAREPARAAVLRRVLVGRAQAGGGGLRLRQARARLRLGLLYYLWVLTWGLGWVPLAAAVAGAVRAFAEDVRRALFLSRGRSSSSSTWGRRSASSAAGCCPRSRRSRCWPGCAVVRAVDALGAAAAGARGVGRDAGHGAARAGPLLQRALGPRPLARRHAQPGAGLDGREHRRRARRSWSSRSCRTPGSPTPTSMTPRPLAPAASPARAGAGSSSRPAARRSTSRAARSPAARGASSASRTTSAPCGPRWSASYARGGYCWVVSGSTQYGRALADPGRGPERDRLLPRRWPATPTSRR